jgi:hypothetical protein
MDIVLSRSSSGKRSEGEIAPSIRHPPGIGIGGWRRIRKGYAGMSKSLSSLRKRLLFKLWKASCKERK